MKTSQVVQRDVRADGTRLIHESELKTFCVLTEFIHTIVLHDVENSWRRLNQQELSFSQRLHPAESPWLQMTSTAAGVRLCVSVCVSV